MKFILLIIITSISNCCLFAQSSSNYNYNGVYSCPPLSGPGTGVCFVDLRVKNGQIKGVETCGGHDDLGRTESSSTIFVTTFRENYLFRLDNLLKKYDETSFPGFFFKFKLGKLYIYDENEKIVHDFACCYGGDERTKDEEGACDCVVKKQSY